MDLQCILYIADSSYTVKTPKDRKNWKFADVSLKTGDFEIKREDGRQPLKTGELECMVILWKTLLLVCGIRAQLVSNWEQNMLYTKS